MVIFDELRNSEAGVVLYFFVGAEISFLGGVVTIIGKDYWFRFSDSIVGMCFMCLEV